MHAAAENNEHIKRTKVFRGNRGISALQRIGEQVRNGMEAEHQQCQGTQQDRRPPRLLQELPL
jgi:hypothetical protein